MTRGVSVIPVLIGLLAVPAMASQVVNGNFNEVRDGRTVGWNSVGTKYVYRDGEGRNGTRALAYSNEDPKFYTYPSQRIELKAGRVYEYEIWVRTENMRGPGATICIEWSDAKGKWLGGTYGGKVTGTRDWTRIHGTTCRIPEKAVNFHVHPYADKGSVGKAWFDDLMVREYVLAPVEAVYSTAYRNLAADGTVTFKAALNLKSEEVPTHTVWFRYTDAAGESRRVPAQEFDRETAALTLDVSALRMGEQKVRAEVCRADGAVAGSAELAFTCADRLPERAVWFDRLGRTIVRGKPFFPLGMFWYGIVTNKIDTYAKGPFNCLMPYTAPNRKELLDYCDAKGLKVIYTLYNAFYHMSIAPREVKTEEDEVRYVTDRVTRFKDHPAVLAWNLSDEMPLSILPRLTARRALVERLDPGHPTWAVQYQRQQIREYMPTFDVIGTDPYPIGNGHVSAVTKWTRETAAGAMGCKPIWQVPQAFNWLVYRKNEPDARTKYRAPTEEELRNMCWQCIANGANGLILYSYFDLSKPTVTEPFEKKWAECCKVGSEIRAFFPVLLSDEKVDTPPVKCLRDVEKIGDDVSVRSWWKDGEAWVLLVNAGDQPVRANVQLDGRFKTIRSTFSSGGELVRDDEISVPLAPLGVSFVRLAP